MTEPDYSPLPLEPTEPTHPYWDLYREAQATAASYGGLVGAMPQSGRWLMNDTELVRYVRQVLVRRPLGQCNREHQVAVWLRRIVCGPERWHRCWTRAVVEAGMEAARPWDWCGTSSLPEPVELAEP